MHALRKLQQCFASDIWGEELSRLEGVILDGRFPADRLFQVYRNNFWIATEDALAGIYRVVRQLVGDAFQQDAATGFLVTAAALLPGQIGQDDESKRLARQDALSEILINTGEAFLGLSIGCARCHDHKFDPITQRDYYSMQAFFSGVRFGERPIQSPTAEAHRQEIESMKSRIDDIDYVHRIPGNSVAAGRS